MADKVFDTLRWPVFPESMDSTTKKYLQDMQLALERFLTGTLSVSGDVAVGGYVYLMGPDRIRTPTP